MSCSAAHRFTTLALLAFLLLPNPAWSWGCEGHEIIARIAEKHLTAAALRGMRALLEPSPIDPRLPRLCRQTGDPFSDVSTWADDVRSDERSPLFRTGPWHFIDLPRALSSGDVGGYCPVRGGCIISALEHELAVLRQPGTDHRRAEALMLVIHLIGDLHQPLHCATNNDAGGNCVPVAYFRTVPRLSAARQGTGVYQPNLHSVWDTSIIRHLAARRSAGSFADLLGRQFADRVSSWERAGIDLRTWAWESHAVAERSAYGRLPVPLPVASPNDTTSCRVRSQQLVALQERVGRRYENAVRPAIEEQLAKAGVRLALVLNQIWK